MEIQIQSPQASYVAGEEIQVDVAVRNAGPQAVTLPLLNDPYGPQPYFVISGPSFPKPRRIHWSGKPPTGSQPPREVQNVAPGASLSARLTLPPSLVFPKVGAHEIFATYEWNGTVSESNRIRVNLEAPGPPIFRVVGRTPLSSEVSIQALNVNGTGLFLATFAEERPEIGETAFEGITRIGTADPGATDFFAPWCQTAEAGVIGPRFGWRNGNAITVAGFRKLPQRIELPFTPKIYGHSLMGANGDIDLLITDTAGTKLALVRFPNVNYDQPPPAARVLWTRDLSKPVSALSSTINPAGARFGVLRQGSSVSLLTWDDKAPNIQPEQQVDGTPVNSVASALHASVAGVVRASVLTGNSAKPHSMTLTELTWKPGAAPELKKGEPIELPAGIRTGTVAYSMSSVESPRRAWFLVLENGRVVTSAVPAKARPTKSEVTTPPQLLVMRRFTYCISFFETPRLSTIQ